ncbi:MAG TPA: addiction module protein [Thermoanaerobaculia bacterium]|jgi:putative addiction module component (TIGR02574 family)
MLHDSEKFLSAALDLPERDRAEIAAKLLESLDRPEHTDVDEAWAREIERRCGALDSGEAVTSDWEAFRSRVERDIFGR